MSTLRHFDRREALIQHIPRLRAFAWLMTNDRAKSDEAVTSCLTDILTMQDEAVLSKLSGTWPLQILRRVLIDAPFFSSVDRARRIGAAGWTSALNGEVRQALAAIPFVNREAVILTSCFDFAPYDVAEICGCDEATLVLRRRRGLLMLHALLNGERSPSLH